MTAAAAVATKAAAAAHQREHFAPPPTEQQRAAALLTAHKHTHIKFAFPIIVVNNKYAFVYRDRNTKRAVREKNECFSCFLVACEQLMGQRYQIGDIKYLAAQCVEADAQTISS